MGPVKIILLYLSNSGSMDYDMIDR